MLQQVSVCELSMLEAERAMAQLVENQGLALPLRRAMMNVALDHVHDVCSTTQGLREGEWLIFMPEEEDGHAFEAYFIELSQSFINGPLSLLHGQGATMTAVKASGMSQHHPEHPDPCICVLFEDCWDIEEAKIIYDCLREHHPQYLPYGVKARIYSHLDIYFNNIYGVDVCLYTAADFGDL
ncbi:unnamed protein product [Tilletia controversa]|nr:unnamed protein product [Tilletia controversa]